MAEPRLEIAHVGTADGRRLPLRRWLATGEVAVVLALHGFNDYGAAFAKAGAWWAERGITTYAFDQRGFGAAPEPGIWPGAELLAGDARAALALVKARHLGKPVYLLGNSMGAAVALTALRGQDADTVAGVITTDLGQNTAGLGTDILDQFTVGPVLRLKRTSPFASP